MSLSAQSKDILNKMNPDAQKILLGDAVDAILTSALGAGAVATAALADGILSSDATGRGKMGTGFVTATELGADSVTDAKKLVVPFVSTATLTAAAAATPVDIVPTASVPTGKKIYITGLTLNVSGATGWTDVTATKIVIADKAASPIPAIEAAKAQLTGNAVLGLFSTGITLATPVKSGTGLTATKGLTISADGIFAAGSDIIVTVSGFIK